MKHNSTVMKPFTEHWSKILLKKPNCCFSRLYIHVDVVIFKGLILSSLCQCPHSPGKWHTSPPRPHFLGQRQKSLLSASSSSSSNGHLGHSERPLIAYSAGRVLVALKGNALEISCRPCVVQPTIWSGHMPCHRESRTLESVTAD